MKKETNKILYNKISKIIVFIVSFFAFLISVITLYQSFNNNRTVDEIEYMYNSSNNIDYKVYLYENSFFEEEYLGMNKQYTSKLIKNISVEFINSLSVSQLSNVEYDYTVKATINGQYQNNSNDLNTNLWTKEYILLEESDYNVSNVVSNEIKIPVVIDFPTYQSYVSEFQKQLRLDIEASLKVELFINYRFYVLGDRVNINEVVSLNIPLSDPTFKIDTNIPEPLDQIVFVEVETKYNIVKIVSSVILLIGSLLGFGVIIIMALRNKKKSKYVIKLNKILKDYGDIIAETINLPNLDEQEILDIREFDDLIDIEEELKIPIIYYEQRKNKEGWFILTHGKQTYRYVLKDTKNKKK